MTGIDSTDWYMLIVAGCVGYATGGPHSAAVCASGAGMAALLVTIVRRVRRHDS